MRRIDRLFDVIQAQQGRKVSIDGGSAAKRPQRSGTRREPPPLAEIRGNPMGELTVLRLYRPTSRTSDHLAKIRQVVVPWASSAR